MGDKGDAFALKVADELRAEKGRKKGLTFEALVEQTAISKSALHNYFNGSRDIPLPALVEVCGALGVDPKVIFERAEKALEQD